MTIGALLQVPGAISGVILGNGTSRPASLPVAFSLRPAPSFIKRLIFKTRSATRPRCLGILRHSQPQMARKSLPSRRNPVFSIAYSISAEEPHFSAVDCFLNKPKRHTCFKKLLLANLK
jgi:hypothetical protein